MSMKLAKSMINRSRLNGLFLIFFLCCMCSCTSVIIAPKQTDFIFEITVDSVFDHLYDRTYETLEESKFFVVKELNIGATLKRNKKRWGDNYNKNDYEEVRTLVLCNPWYANEVLNQAPKLMSLCPLAVAFLHKEGRTTIVYALKAPLSEDTSAHDLFIEIDAIIIAAIEKAVKN